MTHPGDCGFCHAVFTPAPGAGSGFCPSCLERFREESAAADARAARVAAGDLNLMAEGHVTQAELEAIFEARRAVTRFGAS